MVSILGFYYAKQDRWSTGAFGDGRKKRSGYCIRPSCPRFIHSGFNENTSPLCVTIKTMIIGEQEI